MKKSKIRRSAAEKRYQGFLDIVHKEKPSNLVEVADDMGINHNVSIAARIFGYVVKIGRFFSLASGVKPTRKEGANLLDDTNSIS